VLREAPEPRRRIAGLRARRDGPDLDEPEAQRAPEGEGDAVLVEARGHADGVREADAGHLALEPVDGPAAHDAREAAPADPRQPQRHVVRLLGIEAEKERLQATIGDSHTRQLGV